MKRGITDIIGAYRGSTPINKILRGTVLIWEKVVESTSSPLIFTIDTTNAGTPSNQFQFTGAEGDYDVVAKQNNIVVATFNDLSGEQTITLPSIGIYVLEVTPKETNGFNRIAFNAGGDKLKITDIKQWGTIVWSSFERAFYGCSNILITATDVPDLSIVTSMFAMFIGASLVNPDTSNWNVSNVTNMVMMFRDATSANPDTLNWDVSNVTDMTQMFFSATSANPDTSNWDVSNVTDMKYIFYGASLVNPDTSNWNVSNVTNMARMFENASSANPDTLNWDVSNVTDMSFIFLGTNLSIENLTSIYENWSQLTLQMDVSFSAGNTKYNSSGQVGRDILVNTYNWTITDGGQV